MDTHALAGACVMPHASCQGQARRGWRLSGACRWCSRRLQRWFSPSEERLVASSKSTAVGERHSVWLQCGVPLWAALQSDPGACTALPAAICPTAPSERGPAHCTAALGSNGAAGEHGSARAQRLIVSFPSRDHPVVEATSTGAEATDVDCNPAILVGHVGFFLLPPVQCTAPPGERNHGYAMVSCVTFLFVERKWCPPQ